MRVSDPRLWLGALSAAVVGYLVMGQIGRESPGPISAVHGRETDLAGGAACSQCHGGWFESMADACVDCHEVIGAQMTDGQGLHGVLGGRAERCALCHSEHLGAGFSLVNRQSFALAGASQEKFDHNLIGFRMEGGHLELQCRQCHVNASVAVLDQGQTRFIGLEQGCASCHEDVHEGRMQLGCAKCHGQESFAKHGSLGHEEQLHLGGGHAAVACRDCHQKMTPHSLEALGARRAHARRDCATCHESPHGAGFAEGVAAQSGMPAGDSCIACHEAEHESFRDKALQITVEQHAASGFALDAPHHEVACADCHSSGTETFAVRYPGRGADQCYHCHESPHGGQFDSGPFAAEQCVACHGRLAFEPHAFTTEKHARSALALTGRHLELDCEQCHRVPVEGQPRVFRGTVAKCVGCHDDAHRGYFEGHDAEIGATQNGACAHCHGTTSFAEIPASGFDHGKWTRFPIEGAHAQSECERCHVQSAEPDELHRSFGRVEEHFGRYEGCVTCHRDPHGGDFEKKNLPLEVVGKTGCARCHVQTSFRAFPDGFDHGTWTGFALDGKHGNVGCSACHAPLPEPDDHGRTWGRAAGIQCASCHEDSHRGQFERFGTTDCRRCHRTAVTFTALSFRHNLDSRFKLGEAHADVKCSACHKVEREGDSSFVRYRPLPRMCADCHGEAGGPFRRRRGGGK